MEVKIYFEKDKISKNVCKFIESNIKGDEEKMYHQNNERQQTTIQGSKLSEN